MKAFVLDPPRCTGCEACRVACSIENRIPMERSWRTVHHANPEHVAGVAAFHLSLACNHCAQPACLHACPASAYSKDPDSGAVLLDDSRCIGCRYCSWACPYDAPRFEASRGVMGKCTFCVERLHSGRAPACAAACPTGALGTEDLRPNLPEPAFPGLFQGGLGPSLRIEPGASPIAPAMAWSCSAEARAWMAPASRPAPRKVNFRSEWTLCLFTLVAMVLVGLHCAWTLGGPRLLPPWLFLALGGVAGGLSSSHLGRPGRAWRALANLWTSWLSREVLGFGLFLPSAALAQLLGDRSGFAWIGVAAGLSLLLSMDRLYQVAERRPAWKFNSSDLLPAGLQLAALAAGAVPAQALLAAVRAVLFLTGFHRQAHPCRNPFLATLRLTALVLPPLLLSSGIPIPTWASLATFLLGEALDRSCFYDRLDIPTPAGLLDRAGSGFTAASADPA